MHERLPERNGALRVQVTVRADHEATLGVRPDIDREIWHRSTFRQPGATQPIRVTAGRRSVIQHANKDSDPPVDVGAVDRGARRDQRDHPRPRWRPGKPRLDSTPGPTWTRRRL